jgi:hypothetical protein
MLSRVFAVLVVAAFVLGIGAFTSDRVPWAEAIAPAGNDDTDDDGGQLGPMPLSKMNLNCDQLLRILYNVKTDPANHAQFVDMLDLYKALQGCPGFEGRKVAGTPNTFTFTEAQGNGHFVAVTGLYDARWPGSPTSA